MIGVINWGGNTGSLLNALRKIDAPFRLVEEPEQVTGCERIILPGVGNFGAVMRTIKEKALNEALLEAVREGTPYLGICIGMQILLERSEEAPKVEGLALIKGECRLFKTGKVPQIGFNRIRSETNIIENDEFYYFVNSYYCVPEEDVCVATADYGLTFCAALGKDNIFGVQFHPERSAEPGLRFLRRWMDAR